MAMPLLALKFNLDARALSLGERTAEGPDERFDFGKRDSRRRWSGEDGSECLALFGVHDEMIAKCAITRDAAPTDVSSGG